MWPKGANMIYEALVNNNLTVPSRLFSEDAFVKLPPIGEFTGILSVIEYYYGLGGPVQGGLPLPHRVTETEITHVTCWNNTCSFQALIKFQDFATNSSLYNYTHHGSFFFDEDDKICGGQVNFIHSNWQDINPLDSSALQTVIQSVCGATMLQCTGANQQYNSFQECMTFMSTKAYGGFGQLDLDTINCRLLHTSLQRISPLSASRHCPHSGPTGGGKCIPKQGAYYYSEQMVRYDKCKDTNF